MRYKGDAEETQRRHKGDTKETQRRYKGDTKYDIKTDMQYVDHNDYIQCLTGWNGGCDC